jgi:hypothetical protein
MNRLSLRELRRVAPAVLGNSMQPQPQPQPQPVSEPESEEPHARGHVRTNVALEVRDERAVGAARPRRESGRNNFTVTCNSAIVAVVNTRRIYGHGSGERKGLPREEICLYVYHH